MNINYLIYRIFETKWKRKMFDDAINELKKMPELTDKSHFGEYYESQTHWNKSNELMDLII